MPENQTGVLRLKVGTLIHIDILIRRNDTCLKAFVLMWKVYLQYRNGVVLQYQFLKNTDGDPRATTSVVSI